MDNQAGIREDRFFRSTNLDAQQQTDVLDYYDQISLPGVAELTPLSEKPELYNAVLDLLQAQNEWFQSFLGKSWLHREGLSKIYVASPEQYKEMKKTLGLPEKSRGVANYQTEQIIVSEGAPLASILHDIMHELVHRATARVFRGKAETDDSGDIGINAELHQLGLTSEKNKRFLGLTEVLTEMMNLEILEYAKEHDLMPKTDDEAPGYPFVIILMDMLLQKITDYFVREEAPGKEIKETIRKALYTALLNGDIRSLLFLRQSMKFSQFRILATLDPNAKPEYYWNNIVPALGLDKEEYGRRCVAYSRGEKVSVLDGIEMAKPDWMK